MNNSGKPWSDIDKQYVIDKYADIDTNIIASHLNRTSSSVHHKANRLNIHKVSRCRYKEKAYTRWYHMIRRCEVPHDTSFDRYGKIGRGVCPEWHDYEVFKVWFDENNTGEDNLEIDRIDNDLLGERSYSPENCRLVDSKTNSRNSRSTKLTFDKVIYIHYLVRVIRLKQYVVAKRFDISWRYVSYIIRGKAWRDAKIYFDKVILTPALNNKNNPNKNGDICPSLIQPIKAYSIL